MGKKTTIIRGEDEMLRKIKECSSLGEYRDRVLGVNQDYIARRARVSRSAIAKLESGELPKKHRCRKRYMDAYQLERHPKEFETLAKGGAA